MDFKRQKDLLKAEVGTLHKRVMDRNKDVLKSMGPALETCFRDLEIQVQLQNSENVGLQNEILEIKKELDELQHLINSCQNKVKMMEDDLGLYTS